MIKRLRYRKMRIRHKRMLEEWQGEIQKIDREIADTKRAANDRLERMKLMNPQDIVVIFDARHNTGFVYKNTPFWRTILGPIVGIVVSFVAVEMLKVGDIGPKGWPLLSLLAFYLLVTVLMTALTNRLISQRYDRDRCANCGKRKNSWKPLCRTCWDDYKLQQVNDEIPKLIEKFIKEEREQDKERESHPQKFYCIICKSRLRWSVGWNGYVCAEHGDVRVQYLQNLREFFRGEIRFLEKSDNG